jgi:nitrite reductase/ring-hydroxylating ferredoxin subunit
LHGYLDTCPHYAGGTPMAWRSDAYLNGAGTHLACHSHGALFEIDTGVCVLGPCLGQRLRAVQLNVTQQGRICAVLPVEVEERT